eukprot:scaffold14375_cov133-Isochrysis_galbana.AAC.4
MSSLPVRGACALQLTGRPFLELLRGSDRLEPVKEAQAIGLEFLLQPLLGPRILSRYFGAAPNAQPLLEHCDVHVMCVFFLKERGQLALRSRCVLARCRVSVRPLGLREAALAALDTAGSTPTDGRLQRLRLPCDQAGAPPSRTSIPPVSDGRRRQRIFRRRDAPLL